jgi:hypothetical protein
MGDDTFKTLPGGLLSIFINIVLLSYSVLKFSDMVNKVNWQITQQTVVAPIDSLREDHRFSDHPNVSMALTISPKR